MGRSQGLTGVGRVLEAVEAASPLEAVDVVARELGSAFDAEAVSFLIKDMSGRALVRLAHVPAQGGRSPEADSREPGERRDEEESATKEALDGGPAEQALRTQRVQVVAPTAEGSPDTADWWRVLAPVTERGESIGLLELYLRGEPDRESVEEIAQVAHLLAFVVIANRRHTDLFEWGQRSRTFSMSAEIQQRLLPEARTCEAVEFTLAGWLEPAADIGGDTFDYSLARDLLHLSLTDAMGHGVNAALTASMCLAGLRGGRRKGFTLLEQANETNRALAEHAFGSANEAFVTGLVGHVDLDTGSIELVNAGHVAPYLLRRGDLKSLALRVDLPFGMFAESSYGTTQLGLEPGDRLVFVTDGMLERDTATVDLGRAIRDTSDLHPREVVRALADSVLAAAGDGLQDDATVLCLDWHGSSDESRESDSGASVERASD